MVHAEKPGLQTEFVCVEASNCFVIPESMTFNEAAAFPINYLTAYFCLFDIGNLRNSQTVLIPSAGGRIRTIFVSISSHFMFIVFRWCWLGSDSTGEKCS